MADPENTHTWKFAQIGADDLKKAITSLGEEAVKQQAADQRAAMKSAEAWRLAADKKLGTAKFTTASLRAELLKEERDAKASIDRIEKERIDSAKRTAKAQADEAKKATREAESEAKKAARIQVAEAKRAAAESARAYERIGTDIQNAVLGAITNAFRETMKLQGIARRMVINARRPGESRGDPMALARGFEQTAVANAGMTAEDVAGGVGAFRTRSGGSLQDAVKFQDMITKTAQAFDTGTEQVGNVAGKLFRDLKITDVKEMGDALGQIGMRARASGQSFNEAAGQFAMASSRAKASGFIASGAGGVNTMNALMAAAGQGGTPEMAGRSVAMLLGKLDQQATKLKTKGKGGLGLDIYKTDQAGHEMGEKRPIEDILADMFGKVRSKFRDKKDETNAAPMVAELKKILGGGPRGGGYAVAAPMVDAFNAAYASTKGTDKEKEAAATEAVIAKFHELEDAQGSYKDVLEDSAAAQSDPQAQMIASWEAMKSVVGEELTPTLVSMATELKTNRGVLELFTGAVKLAAGVLEKTATVLQGMGLIKGGVHSTLSREFGEKAQAADVEARKYADYDKMKPGKARDEAMDKFATATAQRETFLKYQRDEAHKAFEAKETTTLFDKDNTWNPKAMGWDPLSDKASLPGAPGAGGAAGGAGEHKAAAAAHKDAAGHLVKAAGHVENAAKRLEKSASVFDGAHPAARR